MKYFASRRQMMSLTDFAMVKKFYIPRQLFLALGVLCSLLAPAAVQANRTALVIGNENYADRPLANAKGDASAVAAMLRESGFEVIFPEAGTVGEELKKKWNNAFLPAVAANDEAVIYFQGYAVRIGDDNYLLPLDARPDNEGQVKTLGLSVKSMLEGMQQQKPRLLLMVLDASHKSSAASQGLAPTKPLEGQVVLYAAAEGKNSLERLGDDDPRTRSVFSRVFLRELGRPGAALPDMLRAIQEKVSALAKSAGKEQLPAVFGQAPSDFRLRPTTAADAGQRLADEEERQIWDKADAQRSEEAYRRVQKAFPDGALAAKAKDRLADQAAWNLAKDGALEPLRKYVAAHPAGLFIQKARPLLDEGELWDKAQGSSDLALVKDYLSRYPQGRFIEPAKTLFAKLDAQAAAKREEDAWNSARKGATPDSFDAYLKAYPLGRFAGSARESIENIVWDKAQKGHSEASFEEYLKTYPDGRFAAKAKENTEQIVWDKALKSNSEASFGDYLSHYPQGRFAVSARDNIEQLVWGKAVGTKALDATRAYLQRYPQGKFAVQAKDQEEDILWNEARQCDANDQSRDAFRCDSLTDAFVQRYSAGRYGAQAKQLQQTLMASRPEREERKALADALATGETAPMQAFLDRFPKGKHYVDALEKLAALWQKKAPLPMSGTPFQDNFTDGSGKGPEMVALPGGRFIMGSEEALPEKPPHTVVIAHPFAIGKHEVTFDDWDACFAEKDKGGCLFRPDDEVSMLIFRWKGRGKQPVVNLVRDEVQQYLNWLSAKTGHKYRLLTEAEWEYAVRAGTKSRYSFGDNSDELARYGWYTGNGERQAHPVGKLAASANGLYDMYGNVAEWVQDCWHGSYEGAPLNGSTAWVTNCIGAANVTRGGYFYDTASNQRSASRGRLGSTMRSPTVGFRVARDYP